MYFDKSLMFMDEGAFGDTPDVLNLDVPTPGKGQGMKIHLSGAAIVGLTAIAVKTGATSGAATTLIDTLPCSAAQANAGFSFFVPMESQQYLTISLTGITAGTVTAGIVFDTQTAG